MTLAHHLTTLTDYGLLNLAQLEPELEYLFRHALIQDAAYHSLLKTDRKRFHHLAAVTLQALYTNRLEELSPVLGYHFQHAEEHESAIHYFAQAGTRALGTFANLEAIEYFSTALTLTAFDDPRRADFLINLGDAQYRQGQQAQAITTYREAARQLEVQRDYDQIAWVYTQMSRFAFYSNDLPQMITICLEGAALLRQPTGEWPLVPRMVDFLRATALSYFFLGDPPEAARWAEMAIALAEQLGDPAGRANALLALGTVLPHSAARRKREALEQSRELAQAVQRLDLYQTASYNLADMSLYALGECERASALFAEATEALRQQSFLINELWSICSQISACLRVGDQATVESVLPRLRSKFKELANPGQLGPTVHWVEAEYLYYLGQTEAAIVEARAGYDLALSINDPQSTHFISHLLGWLLIETGQWEAAQPILLEHFATGQKGFSWGEAIPCCLLSISEARQGNLISAQEWIARARAVAGDPPPPVDTRWLMFTEAEVARTRGELGQAQTLYRATLQLDQQKGERWYQRIVQGRLDDLNGAVGKLTKQ